MAPTIHRTPNEVQKSLSASEVLEMDFSIQAKAVMSTIYRANDKKKRIAATAQKERYIAASAQARKAFDIAQMCIASKHLKLGWIK